MKNYILTIITVTKNCHKTIKRTILSVNKIKNKYIEYIIIDGNSIDGTKKIIKSHSSSIDYYISESDKGIYNAMNKGIKYSRGKFVMFLNGDDEIIIKNFVKIIKILKSTRTKILIGNTIALDEMGYERVLTPSPIKLLFYNSIPHPSAFVDKQLLIKFPFREDLTIASDYDFFLNCFLRCYFFKKLKINISKHYYGGISKDSVLSENEVDNIKRFRLSMFYKFIITIQKIFRFLKNFFYEIKR